MCRDKILLRNSFRREANCIFLEKSLITAYMYFHIFYSQATLFCHDMFLLEGGGAGRVIDSRSIISSFGLIRRIPQS